MHRKIFQHNLNITFCLFKFLTEAKTVAHDFESGCVSEEKAEFSLVAEEGFEPRPLGYE